jgi:putative FmdB family regulatory protein
MPTFDFVCDKCGHTEEIYLHMGDTEAQVRCRKCNNKHMTRQIGGGMPPKISGTENPYRGS